MTKADIADALATSQGISKDEARAMVSAVLDAIVAGAATGEVTLAGFGKFMVTARGARAGRNPQTGVRMVISPSKRIAFRPGKAFKDKVAG